MQVLGSNTSEGHECLLQSTKTPSILQNGFVVFEIRLGTVYDNSNTIDHHVEE